MDTTLLDFAPTATAAAPASWSARGQNFLVQWTRATDGATTVEARSRDELMLLVLDAPLQVSPLGGTQGEATTAAARSICILPPGAWRVELEAGATCVVLSSLREDDTAIGATNAATYATRDTCLRPVGTPWRVLRDAGRVRVLPIDEVMASKDKPRLKMLQTATLSINWVEYEGPRNRRELSPHAHADFEQGSLGLAGNFVHHLRLPWGSDADQWQEDRHVQLGSPSLMVVPAGLIHTSEGVGPGRHLLIDIFSPPRADFIANGWVFNAGDYAAPAA